MHPKIMNVMKKLFYFIPVLALSLVLMLTLTQCKKNYNCKLKVKCYLSETGVDTGKTVPAATLEIYPRAVASGRTVHKSVEDYKNAVTDENGCYEHVYPYEALLDVTATFSDTAAHAEYRGTVQIKLQEGQTVEKDILMIRNN